MSISRRLAAAAVALTLTGAARADQTYPNRPITLVVPFAAGGSSDVIARVAAEEIGRILGQRLVIENVGGAGGSLALARVARAAPDGYTIVIGNSGTNAASYSIYPDLRYTPDDFLPVGLVAKTSPMIAVKKDFAGNLADLLAFARANPGKLNIGHAGVGSSNYLICRMFQRAAGVNVTLVSYRGAGPALQDLLSGQIDGVCDAATSLSGSVRAGSVRALVIATPERVALMPDVPTAAEAGLPAFQAQGWNALFVPKGSPPHVVARLSAALKQAVQSEFVRTRFAELASYPARPEEAEPAFVAALVPREIEKYRELLKP